MSSRKDARLSKAAQGSLTRRVKELNKPPRGEQWIWLTRELLESPAFRGLSGTARQVLFELCIEHTAHGGTENGNLIRTYEQLSSAGVRRPSLPSAISELQEFGFIDVRKGLYFRGTHTPSRYALTWLPLPNGEKPTNRWRTITAEHVEAHRASQKRKWALKRNRRTATKRVQADNPNNGRGTVVPFKPAIGETGS